MEDFENRPLNNTVPLNTGSIADHFFSQIIVHAVLKFDKLQRRNKRIRLLCSIQTCRLSEGGELVLSFLTNLFQNGFIKLVTSYHDLTVLSSITDPIPFSS